MARGVVDILRIAARVAIPEICPVCSAPMLYDDGRDAYVCNCGFADEGGPVAADSEVVAAIAARVAAPRPGKKKVACEVEVSFSVSFEEGASGNAMGIEALSKKLRSELMAAVRSSVTIAARETGMRAAGVTVRPVQMEMEESEDSGEG